MKKIIVTLLIELPLLLLCSNVQAQLFANIVRLSAESSQVLFEVAKAPVQHEFIPPTPSAPCGGECDSSGSSGGDIYTKVFGGTSINCSKSVANKQVYPNANPAFECYIITGFKGSDYQTTGRYCGEDEIISSAVFDDSDGVLADLAQDLTGSSHFEVNSFRPRRVMGIVNLFECDRSAKKCILSQTCVQTVKLFCEDEARMFSIRHGGLSVVEPVNYEDLSSSNRRIEKYQALVPGGPYIEAAFDLIKTGPNPGDLMRDGDCMMSVNTSAAYAASN